MHANAMQMVGSRYGAVVLLGSALLACHARGTPVPLLSAVSPEQVNIAGGNGAMLTVRGHGFDARNRVHFGALRIPDVSSLNDSVMQFAVPTDDTFLPDRGPAPIQPLSNGRYELRVENRFGTSNAMTVTLIGGRDVR